MKFLGLSTVQIYSRKQNYESPNCEFRYHKFFRASKIPALLETSRVHNASFQRRGFLRPLQKLCCVAFIPNKFHLSIFKVNMSITIHDF